MFLTPVGVAHCYRRGSRLAASIRGRLYVWDMCKWSRAGVLGSEWSPVKRLTAPNKRALVKLVGGWLTEGCAENEASRLWLGARKNVL